MKRTTIGQITSAITKGTTPSSIGHGFTNKGINFLRIQDFQENKISLSKTLFISDEVDKALSRSRIYPADVLLSIAGSIGKSVVVPTNSPKLNCNQAIAILRPIKQVVDSSYLSYWLGSPTAKKQIANSQVTATISNLSLGQIKNLKIELPPLDEQQRIANILEKILQLKSSIDIFKNQSLKLKKSIYVEKFGHPSLNPYSLQTKKLKDITKNENNQRIPLKVSDRGRIKGRIPYYGASGIIDHVNNYTHKGERLLISEDGANLISRSTPIAFIAKDYYWVNNHAHVLAYTGMAHLQFLEIFFSLIRLEPYITGSAQPKLNQSNLNNIQIPLPAISEQLSFCKLCSRIDYQQDLLVKQKKLTKEFIKSINKSFFE